MFNSCKNKMTANRITIVNIICSISINIISMLTMPIFSRILGTEGYGIVAIYTTWVTIFTCVVGMKMESSIPNAMVDFSQEKQLYYQSNTYKVAMVWLIIVFLIISVFLKPLAYLTQMPMWIIPLIILNAFGCFALNFLHVKYTIEMKPVQNLWASVGSSAFIAILSILLVVVLPAKYKVYGKIWGTAIPYAMVGILLGAYYLIKNRDRINKDYCQYCLRISLPLVPSYICSAILGQSDRLMLQWMRTGSEVGIYSLAYNFSGVLDSIWYALNNAWVPFYYRLEAAKEEELIKKRVLNYVKLFSVLTIGFMLLSKEVFVLYAGEEFIEGAKLIPIFAIGIYAKFMYSLAVNYEQFMKKTGYIASSNIIATLINVGLNYVLIPIWGIFGATLATAGANIFLAIIHWIVSIYIIRGEYKFSIRFRWFIVYILEMVMTIILLILLPDSLWWIKWGVGAILGITQLIHIFKTKTIF